MTRKIRPGLIQAEAEWQSRRALLKRVNSFSASLSTLVKQVQEQSLTAVQMRGKRLGLLCALLCALLGSVKGWMVGELAAIGPAEIFGLRSVGAICFLLPMISYRTSRLVFDWRTTLTLALRSVVGNVAVAGYYYGFAYLPLAEASLIFYSSPIFTTLIGCTFLGERCGPSQTISLVLSTAGVALVSAPTIIYRTGELSGIEFTQSLQGILGCLVGALAQAVAMVVLRKLDKVSAEVVSFWWALTGAVLCLGANGLAGKLALWRCGYESALVVLMALVGFFCELTMVVALHLEEAGPVSVALTTEIFWAFVLQASLQRQVPSALTAAGAFLILLSTIVPAVSTALRRWRRTRAKGWAKGQPHRGDYEELVSGKGSLQVVDE